MCCCNAFFTILKKSRMSLCKKCIKSVSVCKCVCLVCVCERERESVSACLSVCLYLLCVYYHKSIFTLDQVHIKWVCWHLMMLSSYLFPQPVLTEFEYIMWLYQEKERIQIPREKRGSISSIFGLNFFACTE